MKITKQSFRILAAVLLAIAALCIAGAVLLNPEKKAEVVKDRVVFTDSLSVKAVLRKNSLFGNGEIETTRVFLNITENCLASYRLSIQCNSCSKKGSYDVKITLETRDWNKTVESYTKTFEGGYDLTIPLDLNYYNSLYEQISRELDYKASEPKLVLTIATHAAGHEYQKRVTATLGSKVSNLEFEPSTTKEFLEKEEIVVKDSNLSILRFALIPLAIIPVAALVYVSRKWEIVEGDPYAKYSDFVVKAMHAENGRVVVESVEELVKLAEYLNRPVVRLKGEFAVFDGDVVYVAKIEGRKATTS